MNADLRNFAAQMLRTVLATLWPVVLTAFVSMPLALNRHPGEPLPVEAGILRHMS